MVTQQSLNHLCIALVFIPIFCSELDVATPTASHQKAREAASILLHSSETFKNLSRITFNPGDEIVTNQIPTAENNTTLSYIITGAIAKTTVVKEQTRYTLQEGKVLITQKSFIKPIDYNPYEPYQAFQKDETYTLTVTKPTRLCNQAK